MEKYEDKYDLKTEKGFQEYAKEAKRLIDEIDENDTVLREKYERMVSKRLGISLEAFRTKKIKKETKRLKKAVGVEKSAMSEISRAEKNLAALVLCGKVNVGEDFILKNLNRAELEFIFDEQYGTWSAGEQQREAEVLKQKVEKERLVAKQKDLEERIREAEENHDEDLENQLLAEMNELIRKK